LESAYSRKDKILHMVHLHLNMVLWMGLSVLLEILGMFPNFLENCFGQFLLFSAVQPAFQKTGTPKN
jgi:hypothetical protein